MEINLTSTVSDLKKAIHDKYEISIEVYTLKDNVAGENRKIRALVRSGNDLFPIRLEHKSGSSFIKELIRDYGMNIKIIDKKENAKKSSQQDDLSDLLNSGVNTSINTLTDTVNYLYDNEDKKGLETLMKKLVDSANKDGIYYWLYYVAKNKIFECERDSNAGFEYHFEGDCGNFNLRDFCLYFNTTPNVISPFTSGQDYSWGLEEDNQEDFFEACVLKKINLSPEDLEVKEKFIYAQHASLSILICSLIHWINNSEVSDTELANCFLSVMDPKGQSDQNLIQLCCDLPSLICQHIVGVDFDEYNSELGNSSEMFGDYVHDWVKISTRILDEETFYTPS